MKRETYQETLERRKANKPIRRKIWRICIAIEVIALIVPFILYELNIANIIDVSCYVSLIFVITALCNPDGADADDTPVPPKTGMWGFRIKR